MGNTKIKIDLSQGIIEAEGSEQFVMKIYSEFKERLASEKKHLKKPEKIKRADPAAKPEKQATKKKRKAALVAPTHQMLNDLDLSGGKDNVSLRDFYDQYKAKSYLEKNLTFCYYLEHIINISPLTADHVFTCYRTLNIKAPKALHQSLKDTSRYKGWLDTSSLEDIKTPIAGMNYIEHDMSKAESDN